MRKNVTLVLLLLFVILIVSTASLTVFSNFKFVRLTTDYHENLNDLRLKTQQLSNYKQELNKTLTEYGIQLKREQDLSSKYVDIRSEKNVLETDLETTRTNLAETTQSLISTQGDLADTEKDLTVMTANFNQCTAVNLALEEDINEYESLSDSLDNYVDEMRSNINTHIQQESIEGCVNRLQDLSNDLISIEDERNRLLRVT